MLCCNYFHKVKYRCTIFSNINIKIKIWEVAKCRFLINCHWVDHCHEFIKFELNYKLIAYSKKIVNENSVCLFLNIFYKLLIYTYYTYYY